MSNQKLVDWLGISTKTIYKYFKNKEELLEEVLYLYHNGQYERLLSLSKEQNAACHFFDVWQIAVEMEYKVNQRFYQDLHHYYPELEKKVERVIAKKFEQHFLSIILQGMEQGAFRQDILPEVALGCILTLHGAAVRTERFKRFGLTATDLLLQTTANYIRGLCTDEGLKALEEHIRAIQSSGEVVNV